MDKPWLKSYPEGVPQEINPNKYSSVVTMMESFVSRFNDHVVFSNFGTTMTYAQLDELSSQFAAFLQHDLGVEKGDRVMIMLPNVLQYPVVMFGILKVGAVVVNVNPLYTSHELIHQAKDSGAKTIIVLANFAHVVEEALVEVSIDNVIVTEIGDLLGGMKGAVFSFAAKYLKRMVPNWYIKQALNFKQVMQKAKQYRYTPIDLQGDDIAYLQYTGGTTGRAKGAELTHRNMIANVEQCVAWVGPLIKPNEDVIVGALPLYHIFSLTICCLTFISLGAECMLVTNPRDLNDFVGQLAKRKVNIFVGLNTLFNALINHKNIKAVDFSGLKLTVAGGMPTQRTVAKAWKELTGVPILEGYGLTEASPVVTINPINLQEFNGSIGLPVPSTNITLRDNAGNEVPTGEPGELCVQGPQVMKGYWQKPDVTAKVIDVEGWLHTGDIARMDEKGFVYIVDRKKDMIIVSGFNVYPNEIEDEIATHPGVKEVAVIGVPSEKTGEAVKAFIVKQDPKLTKDGVIEFCRDNLTAYKIPKQIVFVDDLPKSNVGKVLRRELRESAQ